jgi:glycosyltransferase involved in cell wall biosynthesis
MYKTVYPNKVFDYMAAGRPVLLAIDGVIREIVEIAQAGIAVPPGNPHAIADALQTFESNRQLGPSLGQNGRAYVQEHFDRATLADRLLEIMTALVYK